MSGYTPSSPPAVAAPMDPMALFDSIAVDGALRPKEFATLIRMQLTGLLKSGIGPATAMLSAGACEMGADAWQEQRGTPMGDEDRQKLTEIVSKMQPVVLRSIARFDTAHLKTILEMLFRVMDANNNGKIEKSEFEAFFCSIFANFDDDGNFSPETVFNLLFKMVDKNGNGKFSVDEAQGLVDAVAEILSTVIAGGADIAETILESPETTTACVEFTKFAMSPPGEEGVSGCCNECGTDLKPGGSEGWMHKPGSDEDYRTACFEKYEGDDKKDYISIDAAEKLGDDLAGYDPKLFWGELVRRNSIGKQLDESGALGFLEMAFEGVNSNEGMKAQILSGVKMMRDGIGKFETSVGARLYMKAMEFSKGGVDEATFLAQVVPILRDHNRAQCEEFQSDPGKLMRDQFAAMRAAGVSEEQVAASEAACQPMMEMFKDSAAAAAFKKANERAEEFLPEMVQEVFKFLDLDGSGTISQKEITLLKALLDALLHLGQRAISDLSGGEMTAVEGSVSENAKILALTIFDVVDRNGDGKLSLTECVQFVQKLSCFVLGMMKFYVHILIECFFDEVVKALVEHVWKEQGIEEVEKEQLQQMAMMFPMVVQMMMQSMG